MSYFSQIVSMPEIMVGGDLDVEFGQSWMPPRLFCDEETNPNEIGGYDDSNFRSLTTHLSLSGHCACQRGKPEWVFRSPKS